MSIKEKTAAVRQAEQEWEAIPDGRQAADALHKYTSAVKDLLAELDKAAPVRYARQGPPIQMQDVLLACGELNERERVAVQWVLDKVNELPQRADKAPKVLTDEEVERLGIDFIANEEPDQWPTNWTNIAEGFRMGLRYARDNGYLAPAAGPSDEPVAWMVTTRIGSEHVETMARTKEAAKQIAVERYRNGSTVEHSEPVPLYLATAAGLTVEEAETCMDEVGDPPDNPDHFWQWREKVSARLTAAMKAKTCKP